MHHRTFITLGLAVGSGAMVFTGLTAPSAGATSAAGSVVSCHGEPATIVGTNGRDRIVGTPGKDVIAGLSGWDVLRGAGGDDVICGGRGSDHLYGGPGADWLNGQADGLLFDEDQYGDVVSGGGGDDIINGGAGLNAGDRGLDILAYPTDVAPLQVDLNAETAQFNGELDRVLNIEYVNGTDFADTLVGDRYFNFMSGLGGDDTLVGLGGIDFLYGDDGNDFASGGDGDDLLTGGAGVDQANGGDGDDFCNTFESEIACEH